MRAPLPVGVGLSMFKAIDYAWKNIVLYAWSHPWARNERVATFARIVSWQFRSKFFPSFHNVAWINGSALCMRRGMHGVSGYYYYGLHEFADMAFFGHFLRPGDLFADVGANAGVYSVLAGKISGARVIAFEPAAETIGLFNRNIELNGLQGRVQLCDMALGSEPGEARFTMGLDAVNKFAKEGDVHSQAVQVSTADDELAGKGLLAMKVDVEGAEDQVFSSAGRLLADTSVKAVEVETLKPGVREALEGAGFVERFYDPHSRSLSATPLDLDAKNHLFIRDQDFVLERLRSGPILRYGNLAI